MKLYDAHVVTITTGNGNGFGVVIYEEGDKHWVLTCNHVIYEDNKEIKKDIKVHRKNITESDVYIKGTEHKIDIAIIKVTMIEDKIACSLQDGIAKISKTLLVNSSSTTNDTLSAAPYEHVVKITNKESLLEYDKKTSNAYEVKLNHEIQHGYSGSPLFDNGKLVGILNHQENPNIKSTEEGRALCVSNLLKIDKLKDKLDIPKVTKDDSIITVMFKKDETKDNIYDIFINKEILKEMDITSKENQENIKEEILAECIVPNRQIEFLLPNELFTKDIHLWGEKGSRLVDKHRVIFRSLVKSNYMGRMLEYWETKWKEVEEETFKNKFENMIKEEDDLHDEISIAVLDLNYKKKQTVFKYMDENCISVALWMEDCNNYEEYNNFINDLSDNQISELPKSVKSIVVRNKSNCKSHINLMWDNPYDKRERIQKT